MGFFSATYPLFAPLLEREMGPHRRRQNSHATGRVLIIGAGLGTDVDCLPEGLETDLLEPEESFVVRLRERFPWARIYQAPAESIPVEDSVYDTVVASLVLCSVQDVARVLTEVYRVLKPGGRFLLTEHVGHPEGVSATVQGLLEPAWKAFAGGCHLTRNLSSAVTLSRFEVVGWDVVRPGFLFPMVQATLEKRAGP